ncbi:MAG: hypothetical protein C0616_00525 [Desulfuromonas sp.]|nr:MAG: hypothetical protein C0616_00525 [Desulfuromonas sp.]
MSWLQVVQSHSFIMFIRECFFSCCHVEKEMWSVIILPKMIRCSRRIIQTRTFPDLANAQLFARHISLLSGALFLPPA